MGDPFIGGGVGDGGVEDTTRVQLDNDKDENGMKEQIVDHSEVTGPDVLGVVLEEGFPGLVAGGGWSEFVEVFLNGAFTDVETEFEQFAPMHSAPHSRFSCAICLMSQRHQSQADELSSQRNCVIV